MRGGGGAGGRCVLVPALYIIVWRRGYLASEFMPSVVPVLVFVSGTDHLATISQVIHLSRIFTDHDHPQPPGRVRNFSRSHGSDGVRSSRVGSGWV